MAIRWRLTLFNALAIGSILLVLGVTLFFLLRAALLSGIEEDVRGHAREAAGIIETGEALSRNEIERLTLDGIFVFVRDEEGEVLSQTVTLPEDEFEESRDPVWRRALEEGRVASGSAQTSGEDPDFIAAVPVETPSRDIRVVEAGKSYESVHETIETIGALLAAGFAAAFLLSLLGAYLLSRLALSPVEAVVRSVREIGESDLGRRLPIANPRDEIGRLASTVNGLLARLQAAFARREEAITRQEEMLARQRRFAADASHELRTPLTTIGGYARMLKDWGLGDPKAMRRATDAIEKESDRMREMVEDLLALTRADEGATLVLERADLATVAEEAAETARAAARGKVPVRYLTPDGSIEAVFDKDKIRQVATILLDNAVKYTPEGGSVSIAVGVGGDQAELEVSDTGIGISEDQLALVFERFYRVERTRGFGGTGLGLAIARQIVETHHGTIEARSRHGEGSSFVVRLPKEGPVEE